MQALRLAEPPLFAIKWRRRQANRVRVPHYFLARCPRAGPFSSALESAPEF